MTSGKKYLRPVDDNLPVSSLHSWTKNKLFYLSSYLEQFVIAMSKKPWRSIHYIDLFAGYGKIRIQETDEIILGSPLLALTLQRPFGKYFFADENAEALEALKKRCMPSSRYNSIRFFQGNANIQVRHIQQEIQSIDRVYIPGRWSSLNLAFLDPYGLELKWETVESLAKINRMDLIIYYSQMGISREAPKEIMQTPPTLLDTFFGNTEWRGIYQRYRQQEERFLHRKLMDLYKHNLEKLGYKIVVGGTEPVVRNTKSAPLYRLLFMSKHELGYKFWENAVRRDSNGQMRLIP